MQALKRFVSKKDGTLKIGAVPRVAEYLGVNRQTVRHWINGDWKPGKARHARILEMITLGIDLSPNRKNAGRPKGSKTRLKNLAQ